MQLHAACRDMMRRTAQIQRIETFQPCSVMRSARQPVEKAEGCSIVVSCDVTSRTRQQSFKAPVQAFCRGMSLIGGLYMWVEYASPGVERYSRIGLTWSWKSALRLWDAIWDGVMVVCIKTYCRGAIHRLDGVSEPVGAIRDEGSTLIGRQRGGSALNWVGNLARFRPESEKRTYIARFDWNGSYPQDVEKKFFAYVMSL